MVCHGQVRLFMPTGDLERPRPLAERLSVYEGRDQVSLTRAGAARARGGVALMAGDLAGATREFDAALALAREGAMVPLAVRGILAAGAHVHTHNVASGRGRGDLTVAATPAVPRLAEPPDDRSGA